MQGYSKVMKALAQVINLKSKDPLLKVFNLGNEVSVICARLKNSSFYLKHS